MKFTTLQAAIGSASLLFATPVAANLGHRHAHQQYAKRQHAHRHDHAEVVAAPKIEARKARCQLPDDPDLVRVPGADNNGFAMSPDEPCVDGTWCPLACVSGKLMAQWKPNTSYTYPESMYGGLYCNGGKAEKPFDSSPYCVDGTGAVKAVNKAGSIVSFCQTVLPGNEAMIIPTDVTDSATLAVPGPDYWAGTAAHYYVNAPGIPASRGCVWGKISEPIGNWSPYVAGANTVPNGDTYVKIAWNPEFTNTPSLAGTTPTYGLRIECPGGGCNGLPCAIDPSKGGVGGLDSPVGTSGVGGAAFCVVTVPKGGSANIVVFNTDGSVADAPDKGGDKDKDKGKDKPAPSSKAPEPPKSTAAEKPTSSSTPSSTSTPPTTTAPSSSTRSPSSTASQPFYGGVFQEQEAHGDTTFHFSSPATTAKPSATQKQETAAPVETASKNEGGAAAEGGSAIAGLVVALVAAAALF